MRKSLGVFAVLLVLLVSMTAVGFAAVSQSGTEIEIEEEILYGDKAVAEGLTLQIPVSVNGRLFWDTEYVVGDDPAAETDFRFYQDNHYQYGGYSGDGFSLEMYSGGGSSTNGSMDLATQAPYGMEDAFIDVASRTGAGESHTERVKYRDYYEYYSLNACVQLNNGDECIGSRALLFGEEESETLSELEQLVGQFKVPIPEDCILEITIEKDMDGDVKGYDFHTDGDGALSWNSFSVVTEDALYYGIECRVEDQDGSRTPVVGMEEWYGVYRMPYEVVEEPWGDAVKPGLDQIEKVLTLDTEISVLEMRLSKDESKVLMFTAEGGMSYLNVLDLRTMETVQRLELLPWSDETVSREINFGENLMVWIVSDDRMAVISEPESGVYQLEFTTDMWAEEFIYGKEAMHLTTGDMSVDYDGEKLAIVYPLGYYYRYERQDAKGTCMFWLMVYDQSGMLYCGEYSTSQGIGEGYGSAWANIRSDVKMGVSWGE